MWQAHFKKLANNNKLCLAYVMISTGYISYTRLLAPCTLPPDLTKSRLVNELCNLLKGSYTKNTQPSCRVHFERSELAAPSVADPTCAGLYSVPGTWMSHPFSTGDRACGNSVAQDLWHMPMATACSPALLCPQGWWSSFQSTVTAAMPCASYTNLFHAQNLHFPK